MTKRKQVPTVTPKHHKTLSTSRIKVNIHMNNRRKISVQLPGQAETIVLPPTLALALGLIINSGQKGISTPSLQNWGIYGVQNTISRLRKLGVGIRTRRAHVQGHDGDVHTGVGYYSYDSALTRTRKIEAPVAAFSQPSFLGRVLSNLKGII